MKREFTPGTPLPDRLLPPVLRSAIRGLCMPALVLLCLLGGAGCEPRVALRGLVTNIDGEPLPGVSVKVEAAQAHGVTDGNGWFGDRPNRIAVPPGTWELVYIKTGFTTARQTVDTGESGVLVVPEVTLWPLPAAKGVYVLEDLIYEPLTRVTPEPYDGVDGGRIFGIKLAPELNLDQPPEYFISHNMANYDWQLSRLETVQVLRPGVEVEPGAEDVAEGLTDTVWAASVRLPIETLPVDLPEQQLWQIRPAAAMRPGVYALHWGALEGDSTTEESIYIIGINDPEAADRAQAEGQEAGDGNGASPGEGDAGGDGADVADPEAAANDT